MRASRIHWFAGVLAIIAMDTTVRPVLAEDVQESRDKQDTGDPRDAPDAIEVPPIEIEGLDDTPRTGEVTGPRMSVIQDPANLDSPDGPLREARSSPSVLVRSSGGIGQPATIGLRGMDTQSTLATLDGVVLNSPFLGGADLAGLSLMTLDSLSIRRGGLSNVAGSGAAGGIVEATTIDPMISPGTQVSLTAGSFGTARLKVSHAASAGAWGAAVSAGTMFSSGDFPFVDSNGRGRRRTNNAMAAVEAMARVVFEPARGHSLSFLAEGAAEDRDVPGLEQFPSSSASSGQDRIIVRAGYEGPGFYSGTVRAMTYFRRMAFAYRDTSPPMGPPVSAVLSFWEGGANLDGREELLDWLALSWGAGSSYTAGRVDRAEQADDSPSRTVAYALAGAELGLADRSLGLLLSTRVEWDQGFGFIALPRADAWYEPLEFLGLFAGVGRSFRLPTFEELYFDVGFVQGNPSLHPEDAITWEAGARLTWPGVGVLEATYYENRVDNLIMFLPVSAFLVRADDSSAALIRGFELSVDAVVGPLEAGAAYTYMRSAFLHGTSMPHRPRHSGFIEAVVDMGVLRVGMSAALQSAFYLDRFESLAEEGRCILDARVEVIPAPELSLVLEVRNLLDKRDAVDYLQYPLPGISFYGTLRLLL